MHWGVVGRVSPPRASTTSPHSSDVFLSRLSALLLLGRCSDLTTCRVRESIPPPRIPFTIAPVSPDWTYLMDCRRCARSLPVVGLRCPVCRTQRFSWYVFLAASVAAFTMLIILLCEFVTR
jgi:hypothetical protein